MFEELSAWLIEHQLLVTLVATPLLSLVIGGAAAWYSSRKALASAQTERMYQSAIEIGRYRQAWIDALRDDLAEYAGITTVAHLDVPPPEKVERAAVLAQRIRLRVNRSDSDYAELTATLTAMLEQYLLKSENQITRVKPIVPLSQAILKREWERLKADLRKAEK